VRFRLIPVEEQFYKDFITIADEIRAGARLLDEMLAPERPLWDKADDIKALEHRCDLLTHSVIERLHRTFVTPIDREDVHELAHSLDDVMDAIDACAAVVRIYRIESVRFGARELARIIVVCSDKVNEAVRHLERRSGVTECAVEINRLENAADQAHQEALIRLFDEEKDPIAIMKWKEIFDFLEAATDRCQDIGDVLEGVVVKHS
jgi:predicted phosphate transport protein (TIGR00153 family)